MYALFDASEKDTLRFSLFDREMRFDRAYEAVNRDLLKCFDDFLRERDLTADSVNGIFVVTSAGGFTSTRIAAVAANGFAYALGIPVSAISKGDALRPSACIARLSAVQAGAYIAPAYSGKPNINA